MVSYSVILFVAPQHGPLLGYFVCKLLIDVIMPPVVMSLQEDESIEIQTKRIEMKLVFLFLNCEVVNKLLFCIIYY